MSNSDPLAVRIEALRKPELAENIAQCRINRGWNEALDAVLEQIKDADGVRSRELRRRADAFDAMPKERCHPRTINHKERDAIILWHFNWLETIYSALRPIAAAQKDGKDV